MESSTVDKGKGREETVDERTPLLGQQSTHLEDGSTSLVSSPYSSTHTPSWTRFVFPVALLSLAACFFAIIVFVITSGWHYASWVAHVNPEQLVKRGVVLQGPSNVEVVQISGRSIILKVDGAAGIDADWIMGLHDQSGSPLSGAQRWFGRWLADRVDQITVSASDVHIFAPYSRSKHRLPLSPLATLSIEPVTIPLTTRREEFETSGDSWLTPISVQVMVTPNEDTDALIAYVKDALQMRRLLASVDVKWIKVVGGSSRHWWKPWSLLEFKKTALDYVLRYDLPADLPSDPSGSDPVGSLVTLRSYAVHPVPPSSLDLSAVAEVVNPLPNSIRGSLNQPLNFAISLRSSDSNSDPLLAPIARLSTGIITLTHPNISLSLSGSVLPIPRESVPLLSAFLSNFLSARPSPIRIELPQPFSWSVDTFFPAPKEKPRIIRDLQLQNVKMYPDPETGEILLASGTIVAVVDLPPGLEAIKLDIGRILPDVLIFDGPPPPAESAPAPPLPPFPSMETSVQKGGDTPREPFPPPPLPNPLPTTAFARIRPRFWLDALSHIGPDPANPTKNATIVTAQIQDVPLDILPERDAVFRRFIQKIVFKGSAIAGIRGDAAVGVLIEGLAITNGTDMELRGLPIQGVFPVKRAGASKVFGRI